MRYKPGHGYEAKVDGKNRLLIYHSAYTDGSHRMMSLTGKWHIIHPEMNDGQETKMKKRSSLSMGIRYEFPDGRELVRTKNGWENSDRKLESLYVEDAYPVGVMWKPKVK